MLTYQTLGIIAAYILGLFFLGREYDMHPAALFLFAFCGVMLLLVAQSIIQSMYASAYQKLNSVDQTDWPKKQP